MPSTTVTSREHLLHMLAEAAELEHNLLCSYLYAAFSLKRGLDEDLLPDELDAVQRWRDTIMHVCMEEMAHLAQVANLMVAVGSRPHFDRPNLPVAAGYHPASIQVALAPFDLDTLEHFIFLERPADSSLRDPAPFEHIAEAPERTAAGGVLMPSAPEYATIGAFYDMLTEGLAALCDQLGESRLFIGPAANQLRPDEIGIDELSVVTDLRSAQQALHLIIVQGEGAPGATDESHFKAFMGIKEEYQRLQAARPAFHPSRDVARNPVMRAPLADERVHITAPAATAVLDAANAAYALMLRALGAVYDTGADCPQRRQALLGCATGMMALLARLSERLTTLPADAGDGVRAGVSFTVLRSTEGWTPGVDSAALVLEQLASIRAQLPRLEMDTAVLAKVDALIARLAEASDAVEENAS
ncbi:MAG: hypothetical protein JWP59_505 [Massilia sp.]|nr:hypothetical protein [Massilia sp.]